MLFALWHHILLLLFAAMMVGALLSFAGAYTAGIDKGTTRAACGLDLLCWAVALVGLLVFVLAACLFVPRVIA